MTKAANSTNKPSPADTPTHRPDDNGGKSKVRKSDRVYQADNPHDGDVAKQHEREEQPVQPSQTPPAEKGMDKGQVQPQ